MKIKVHNNNKMNEGVYGRDLLWTSEASLGLEVNNKIKGVRVTDTSCVANTTKGL